MTPVWFKNELVVAGPVVTSGWRADDLQSQRIEAPLPEHLLEIFLLLIYTLYTRTWSRSAALSWLGSPAGLPSCQLAPRFAYSR